MRQLIGIRSDETLVRDISLVAITPNVSSSDVTVVPAVGHGGNPVSYSIVDRGHDNNRKPGENDGKAYKIRLPLWG